MTTLTLKAPMQSWRRYVPLADMHNTSKRIRSRQCRIMLTGELRTPTTNTPCGWVG